jgi:hypothetical protein
MFGRKQTCQKCNNKTSKKHDFCPYCGFGFRQDDPLFVPSFNFGFPFNSIIKQLEKQIEKQMKDIDQQMPSFAEEDGKQAPGQSPKPKVMTEGLSISISNAGGQPVIRVSNLGQGSDSQVQNKAQRTQPVKESLPKNKLSEAQIEQLSKLPKEEPQTSVRRLTDRIIYEIDMPGVEEKNVWITKLHNSIEIKALGKDKAYFKLIPIALPILKSQLSEGKLMLELKPER